MGAGTKRGEYQGQSSIVMSESMKMTGAAGGLVTKALAAASLLSVMVLAGCSSAQGYKAEYRDGGYGAYEYESEVSDPLERVNRTTFAVNDAIDRAVLEPVARGYRAVVPRPVRTGIRNFLRNLRSPVNIANQALQGDIDGVARDVTRTALNTVVGVGGLIDVGTAAGIKYEYEDFGQTLAVWGVGHGPYLVLPLLGSSSARDTAGMLVDGYADPVRLYLYNTDREEWYFARVAMQTVDKREELLDALDDLRRNSFDFYAALRSAYYQKRAALARDDNPDTVSQQLAIPDYDDME